MLEEKAKRYGYLKQLIATFSKNHSLNPQIVAGLIIVESGGNPNAYRYEPKFFERYIKGKDLSGYIPHGVSSITERFGRSCSWGLMQIMGQVAREKGFARESLVDLCDPEINLSFGCLILKNLFDSYKDTLQALFHYNAGRGTPYKGPQPNDYPSKILAVIDNGKLQGLA